MKSFRHVAQTIDTPRIKDYLALFPETKRIKYYGYFWLIVESLFMMENKWEHCDKSLLLKNRTTETKNLLLIDVNAVDKAIKGMIKVGLLKEENNYYFSPFQRLMQENALNAKKKRMCLHELESEIAKKEKLLSRLNDKVEFIKSRKSTVLLRGNNG